MVDKVVKEIFAEDTRKKECEIRKKKEQQNFINQFKVFNLIQIDSISMKTNHRISIVYNL